MQATLLCRQQLANIQQQSFYLEAKKLASARNKVAILLIRCPN